MRLQVKLAVYNSLTKVAIITLLGFIILFSINKISIKHLQKRLIEKKEKLIANLSNVEINDLLTKQGKFTDYNLLKEEYIILQKVKSNDQGSRPHFLTSVRIIEGEEQEYQILTSTFSYSGSNYELELGETMASVAQLDHTISIFTFIILLVAVTLTLVADLTFSKFLLNPFYRIIDQKINKVNDPQNFNYQPIPTSTDDFKILDQSISKLMGKMTKLLVTEKEFIANVSHELLTPISIINTKLENLLNKERLSEEGENKLFSCLKSLGRLKSIINSLLLISRVENKQFIKTNTISTRTAVSEVYEELAHRLLMKQLSFTDASKEDFQFEGNQSLFHTLLMNIINNAIKYNVDGGSVTVETEHNEWGFILRIGDTGIGMDATMLKAAFDRFEKFDSIQPESHGLGLAIVKSIADFHELILSIDSQKNVGTRVSILFPK